MPFVKVAPNKYRGPSGRIYTREQVELYYAHGGHFPGDSPKKKRKKRRK